ncbi:MAG: DegT/DnrJ/EryC1/StrS family aminotransferase [Candidatus Bathyarchaeia archaeon]
MSNLKERPLKIPVCSPRISQLDVTTVENCLRSTWISGTSESVLEFEKRFAQYCGCKFGVASNSGTTALHLVLAALGIKEQDEVIIPTFTMIASPNSVSYLGAKPILADSETITWNINVAGLEDLVTPKTKAVMPVHIYGHPVDMDPILDFAREHDLLVIEDAAEAHGAEYKGRRTGSLGAAGCFSFYANKIITTGEGGMIVTNDEELAEKARWLRAHAFGRQGKHFYHEALGFGYRMSGLQAALGLSQLSQIDEFVSNRRGRAKLYNSLLSELGDKISLPPEAPWAKNVYWMYSILIEDGFSVSRQEFMDRLAQKGIETRTFFYPVHVQPIYSKAFEGHRFPVADMLSRKGVNLPSGNNLSLEDVSYVCQCIKEVQEKR